MGKKILNFSDFIGESTINRPNYWQVNHPDKWQALQDLGFRDVTSDKMKKMGSNIILQNDEMPLYPSGIVYQDSGYLRDKSKSSGFITSGKNWIQAADYLIEKFGFLKNNCPNGVPLQFVCFLLKLTDMKVPKKNTFQKLVFNVQNRTVSIFSWLSMEKNEMEEFLSYGYTFDYVKRFELRGNIEPYTLTKEKCEMIFPKRCDEFALYNFSFSPDCNNVHLFPPFKKNMYVYKVDGIDNFNCLSPDQPKKIEILYFICDGLNSLSGLLIDDAERVNIGNTSSTFDNSILTFPTTYVGFSGVQTTAWDLDNWVKVLAHGTPEQKKLISTLPMLSADFWNEELENNYTQTLIKLADLWDSPIFSEIQKGINLTDKQREEIETLSSLANSGIF